MTPEQTLSWLNDEALPLWANAGLDRVGGGFVERLHADASPDLLAAKRSMVQARQIYVYSHAAVLGLSGANIEAAQHGFDFLTRHACPDGIAKGLVHSLDRNGLVRDPLRHTYDHAFFLLAFSWLYRACGHASVLVAIEGVADAIEGLRHTSGQGYIEDSSYRLPRRQNPHMHLFEAFLAAHAATGRGSFLRSAEEILVLLEHQFVCDGMLREYLQDDLSMMPHPVGTIVEPGHHHEWVWLLQQYDQATGSDTSLLRSLLYEKAQAHGCEGGRGLVYNEVWADGALKDQAKRLWPQTEALKSALVMGGDAAVLTGHIWKNFLQPAPRGAWIDRLGPDNQPLAGSIPASSFYHVFLAFSCYLAGTRTATSP